MLLICNYAFLQCNTIKPSCECTCLPSLVYSTDLAREMLCFYPVLLLHIRYDKMHKTKCVCFRMNFSVVALQVIFTAIFTC